MSTYAVLTTIQAPTTSVEGLRERLSKEQIELIVAGDRKGPSSYPDWARFLSIEDQLKLPFGLARLLPEKHYARKNLGYLVAFQRGATCIYETDDDNAPLGNWIPRTSSSVDADVLTSPKWVNIYKHYTPSNVWPRGLGLDSIHETGRVTQKRTVFCPVRQGLANGSPDVDAIWRLALDTSVTFSPRGFTALEANVWCPFNSQNTWWSKEAFVLMYLPSFVSFRMTDIWRSFVAQRCFWAMGANLAFHDADVIQERNVHNLMRDFADEVPGYLNNNRIVEALAGVGLRQGVEHAAANLAACYQELVRIGTVPEQEIALVQAWVKDCQATLC